MALFRPEGGAPNGTVILVQGRAELIELYGETIADLTARGYAVATFDFRGQGGSERKHATGNHITSIRAYVDDLVAVVRLAAAEGLPKPFTVLAHSMGALVALHAQPSLARDVTKMVLYAPLFKIARLPAPEGFVKLVSGLACLIGLDRRLTFAPRGLPSADTFANNILTSDPGRYALYAALCAAHRERLTGPPTFGWMRAMFRAMRQTARNEGSVLAVPTLFVACGADRVVSNVAIDRFARSVGGGGMVHIRNARHQVLLETDERRNLFLVAFDAFVGTPGEGADGREKAPKAAKFVADDAPFVLAPPAPAACDEPAVVLKALPPDDADEAPPQDTTPAETGATDDAPAAPPLEDVVLAMVAIEAPDPPLEEAVAAAARSSSKPRAPTPEAFRAQLSPLWSDIAFAPKPAPGDGDPDDGGLDDLVRELNAAADEDAPTGEGLADTIKRRSLRDRLKPARAGAAKPDDAPDSATRPAGEPVLPEPSRPSDALVAARTRLNRRQAAPLPPRPVRRRQGPGSARRR
ncbi:MAG: alpha/beta fold hydrolase [Pseudomonadota bacterium]